MDSTAHNSMIGERRIVGAEAHSARGGAVVCLGLLLWAHPARAQCDPQWLPGDSVRGVYGQVMASVSWDPDGAGPEPELLVIGGLFTMAGDIPVTNVAAWDGTQWRALGAGLTQEDPLATPYPYVRALTVYEGELIAGGNFTLSGSTPVRRIARWNRSEWLPLGSGIPSGSVYSLSGFDGDLVAAGSFTTAGGVQAQSIARWDGSGWHPLGAGINGHVVDLTGFADRLVAVGHFTMAGSAPANKVAAWDGSNWSPLGAGLGDSIASYATAVEVFQGQLFALGEWGSAGTFPEPKLAWWDGVHWNTVDGAPGGEKLAVFGDALIVAGTWPGSGLLSANIAGWTGTEWFSLGAGTNNYIDTLCTHDSELIVGGIFDVAGQVGANSVARWDGQAWHALGEGINSVINNLAVYDGELVAAGWFDHITNIDVNQIASWNGHEWRPLGGGLYGGEHPLVRTMVVHDGELFAGGRFERAGEIEVSNIAKWDSAGWAALGGGTNGSVFALASFNDTVVAGGSFSQVDGLPVANIAQWDGEHWHGLGEGFTSPESGPYVWAMTVFRGDLIAAGRFTASGATPLNRIARWDGSAWHPLGSGLEPPITNPGWNTEASSLTVFGGDLIVGGSFYRAGGLSSHVFARWDGTQWHTMDAGLGVGFPWTFATYDGELLASGWFGTEGATSPEYSIARWAGTEWSALQPAASMYWFARGMETYRGDLFAAGVGWESGTQVWTGWGRLSDNSMPGDWNCDSHVDLSDFAHFDPCQFGPGTAYPAGCIKADFDFDDDADLNDLAELQNGFLPG